MSKTFHQTFRIYYEDTDSQGIVYYANYLKFAERARTEMLREIGINQSELTKNEGVFFVVRSFSGDLKKSAKLDDLIMVETTATKIGGASFNLEQKVIRGDELLVEMHVTIVCVNMEMKPERVPDKIRNALQ